MRRKLASPTPRTRRRRSSVSRKGPPVERAAAIRDASAGPIPRTRSSSAADAALTSTEGSGPLLDAEAFLPASALLRPPLTGKPAPGTDSPAAAASPARAITSTKPAARTPCTAAPLTRRARADNRDKNPCSPVIVRMCGPLKCLLRLVILRCDTPRDTMRFSPSGYAQGRVARPSSGPLQFLGALRRAGFPSTAARALPVILASFKTAVCAHIA